ncbi:MAG: glycosyltransferase family 2 protein [Chloroflexi bacterium]|nr:glycosyltransferase family 2 protein [Chloroflexota bacterium]
MKLSVIILTRNEEKHIRDCIASVCDFADEVLVLDSNSTDRTAELARECGARVEFRAFDNYAAQRNHAIDLARGDWIFLIDADERATPAVGSEIVSRITHHASRFVGYWIPRRNIIFGKEIRHTGWSPDYQPRVMKKGRARFDPAREVHELVLWDGEVDYLYEPLIHYNYETLAQFRAKQIKYTRYEAQIWLTEGKQARWRGAIGQPLREFFRRYVSLQGWRDGGHGLWLSILMAYYAFVRWQMLREMRKQV